MTEVSPSYQNVFTEEYWGELQDLPQSVAVAPPLGIYKQMRQHTASAAEAIFRGSDRTRLPKGTKVASDSDHPDLSPGTVMLLDVESLSIGPASIDGVDVVRDYQKPFHKQKYIVDEGHMMAPPSTLFMLNSRTMPFGSEVMVYPYTRTIPNVEETAQYTRSIRLVAQGVDRKDEPLIKTIPLWEPHEGGSVRGQCSLREALNGVKYQPLEVGQSFINEASNLIIRLKAAEICFRGSLEYAKARKKVKRGAFAGRLALARNHS